MNKCNLNIPYKHNGKKWDLNLKTLVKVNLQAPVVQKLDSAIHRINHYPADSVIDFRNTYPLDSDLSGG